MPRLMSDAPSLRCAPTHAEAVKSRRQHTSFASRSKAVCARGEPRRRPAQSRGEAGGEAGDGVGWPDLDVVERRREQVGAGCGRRRRAEQPSAGCLRPTRRHRSPAQRRQHAGSVEEDEGDCEGTAYPKAPAAQPLRRRRWWRLRQRPPGERHHHALARLEVARLGLVRWVPPRPPRSRHIRGSGGPRASSSRPPAHFPKCSVSAPEAALALAP